MQSSSTPSSGVNFEIGLRRSMGRADLYRRFAERFLSTRGKDGERIASALRSGQHEEAITLTHQLISSAGTVGAEALSALSQALQLSIDVGDSDAWPPQLAALEQELRVVLLDLERHFGGTLAS